MDDAIEILRAARELISVPERWTQGYYAFNRKGGRVSWADNDAVCFCSLGAMTRAAGSWVGAGSAEAALERVLGGPSVAAFNDTHTHAEVLAAFDKAIALAEARNG